MNWKDVPHLFANGKFKITYKDCFLEPNTGVFDGLALELLDGDTTLIARKIEDMTDEELHDCEEIWHDMVYYHDNEYCISAKDAIEINCEAGVFDTILHLLSIGVYPFDQNAFTNGEVIDIK